MNALSEVVIVFSFQSNVCPGDRRTMCRREARGYPLAYVIRLSSSTYFSRTERGFGVGSGVCITTLRDGGPPSECLIMFPALLHDPIETDLLILKHIGHKRLIAGVSYGFAYR